MEVCVRFVKGVGEGVFRNGDGDMCEGLVKKRKSEIV